MKLFKDTFFVFFRSKNLCLPYLTLLVLIFVFFINIFLRYSGIIIWNSGNLISFIHRLLLPCIFFIAFFIYFSYELTMRMYDNNMVEYLQAYKQGLWQAYSAIIVFLLTLVAIPYFFIFAFFVFIYFYYDVQYIPFLIHLTKLSLLYFGLAPVAAIMLGTAMAARLKTKRFAVYSLTVLLILLNTTFTTIPFRVPYLLFNSYWTEKMLYYIQDFFTLVPYALGNSVGIDPIYGFPMEPIRWFLAVFWILFPFILILTECFQRKTKKALLASGCLVLLLGVSLFVVRGSTLITDSRINSFSFADPSYYTNKPREDSNGFDSGFMIEEYRMDLTISNELHAEVVVTLDNNGLDRYDFTLYHGYIVKSVRTEDGDIPFTREGDYISIGSLNGAGSLIFTYYGKSPKYYANSQAITLPGYFAYFPKAGRTNIWDLDQNDYVINISPNESYFTVNVRSNLKVFCNLAGSDNVFQGRSNGLSLFAGMYDEVAQNIYAEPMRCSLLQRDIFREAEKIVNDILDRVARPEYAMLFSEKKLFQVPRNFGLNSRMEDIVFMSDHITFISGYNGQILAEIIMSSLLKPKVGSEFGFGYMDAVFSKLDETDSIYQKPVDLNILLKEINERQAFVARYSDMNYEKYQQMSEQEKEAFLADERRVYSYLISSVDKKAAKYLFYESPHKEKHLQFFFDYFISDSNESYLDMIERIIMEEMKDDYS